MTCLHGTSGSNLGRINIYFSFTLNPILFSQMLRSYIVVNTVIYAIITVLTTIFYTLYTDNNCHHNVPLDITTKVYVL